jgi:hypothetical protein
MDVIANLLNPYPSARFQVRQKRLLILKDILASLVVFLTSFFSGKHRRGGEPSQLANDLDFRLPSQIHEVGKHRVRSFRRTQ